MPEPRDTARPLDEEAARSLTAPALFLEPAPYRRRRLIDAARVLPIFGAFLLLVPALALPADQPGTTARLAIFLFLTWGGIVLCGALIARYLRSGPGAPPVPRDSPESR